MRNLKLTAIGMLLLSLAACNMFQPKDGQYFDADGNEIPKERAEAMIAASENLGPPDPKDENAIALQQEIRRLIAKKKSGQQLTEQETTYLARNRGNIMTDAEKRDLNREAIARKKAFVMQQAKKNQGQPSQGQSTQE